MCPGYDCGICVVNGEETGTGDNPPVDDDSSTNNAADDTTDCQKCPPGTSPRAGASTCTVEKDSLGGSVLWDLNISVLAVDDSPQPVVLQFPDNGSLTGDSSPSFSWFNSSDVDDSDLSYVLEVSNFSDFSVVVFSFVDVPEGSSVTSLVVDLVDGSYFWRVLATDNVSNSSWSESRYFTVDSAYPSVSDELVSFVNDSGVFNNVSVGLS